MLQKSKRAEQEGDHDGKREHVVLNVAVCLRSSDTFLEIDFDDIQDHDKTPNNETLPNFDSVNAGVNVDGVCAKNGDVAHVDMVKKAQVHISTKVPSEHLWDDN